MYLVKETTISI